MPSTFKINAVYKWNLFYLHKKIGEERVSGNIIAERIFGEYIEWQRFIEKFGTVVLSKEVFFTLINVIDEQKLIDLNIRNSNYHSIRINKYIISR